MDFTQNILFYFTRYGYKCASMHLLNDPLARISNARGGRCKPGNGRQSMADWSELSDEGRYPLTHKLYKHH